MPTPTPFFMHFYSIDQNFEKEKEETRRRKKTAKNLGPVTGAGFCIRRENFDPK